MAKAELEEVFEEEEVAAPKKVKKGPKLAAVPAKAVTKKKVAKEEDDEEADEKEPRAQRGVEGTNIYQLLRESFSTAKGLTVEDAVELIREATEGVKARNGGKYPESLMIGRVRKFLAGAKINDQLEIVKEKGGETWYRYTGEVNVARGRNRQTAEEKEANPPKKKSLKGPALKTKVKAKAVEVEEDEEETDDSEE